MYHHYSFCTLLLALLLTTSTCFAQNDTSPTPKIAAEDIAPLIGNWKGTLTYRSYQDDKFYDIETELQVEAGENENTLQVFKSYPTEPNRSGSYKIYITEGGTLFCDEKVIGYKKLGDGVVEIMTIIKGRDDNKRAQIRFTYRIEADTYTTIKEVQYKKSTEWLKRNEFRYERV